MRAAALLVVLVTVGASGPALAAAPHFDAKAHCDAVARFGGGFSETLMDSCMNMEQSAYDAVRSSYDDLPSNLRMHCENVAKFGGPGSYSLLKSCIDMERRAGDRNNGRSFRY
jgi:hypothetical protein